MTVPEETKTVAMAVDGLEAEEVTSPVEKIQLSTLPDPTATPEDLPKEIDACRDDDDIESAIDSNCHDGDRVPTCCFDIDKLKLLCKTDDFPNVAEYLCSPKGNPCFDVDFTTNCDDNAFGFSVKWGQPGDAGTEIQDQEIENKAEDDVTEHPTGEKGNLEESTAREILLTEKVKDLTEALEAMTATRALEAKKHSDEASQCSADGTANISTDEVAGEEDEDAEIEKLREEIEALERIAAEKAEAKRLEALEAEKAEADEEAAAAAAAASAAVRTANLKKEQPTNQEERVAWLKIEFERLEQEYAAAEKQI